MSQVEEWIDKDKAMANGIVDVFLGKSVFMVQVKGDMLKEGSTANQGGSHE